MQRGPYEHLGFVTLRSAYDEGRTSHLLAADIVGVAALQERDWCAARANVSTSGGGFHVMETVEEVFAALARITNAHAPEANDA